MVTYACAPFPPVSPGRHGVFPARGGGRVHGSRGDVLPGGLAGAPGGHLNSYLSSFGGVLIVFW